MIELYRVAVRTWKRDGTHDVMSVESAIENLARHESDLIRPIEHRRDAVRQALLAGETLSRLPEIF